MAALAIAGSCTLKDQSAPSLVGPSELGLSLNMTASPDSVIRDGASQTQVVVWARDANARPYANLSMRLTIECVTEQGRQTADLGALSAKTVATGSDGRANIVYTAPPETSPLDQFCSYDTVWVTATPILDNYANQFIREVEIHLVPPGIIVPPSDLAPTFTYLPAAPSEGEAVSFDATESTGAIASYSWTFGDGGTATGSVVAHTFGSTGSYQVTLTVADAVGRASSTTQIVTVEPGTGPSANFTYSPSAATVGTAINFNGLSSAPAAGRTISSYSWDFGDGSGASGPYPSHTYQAAGTYTVTLLVTDNFGKTGSTTKTVAVSAFAAPVAAFTVSPTSGTAGVTTFYFNASTSTAAEGHSIVKYVWDYGNGAAPAEFTVPTGASATYPAAGTYTVTLTVTDDLGVTNTTTATITVS